MFFERPDAGERALLLHCDFPAATVEESSVQQLAEFVDLARSAGADPLTQVLVRRQKPTAKFFIGTGKVAELRDLVRQHAIEVVLFNHTLSPSQERNLERELHCKVLDRCGLILDIFSQRARSHVGKLQVELAQLQHISTRLIRGWTHLERQKGGIGLRGPGESQLETDRRLLRERIKWIHRRLEKVNSQRQQGRRARRRADLPTVALVGYTNAGKSTLFNRLAAADVYAEDQLFATLDPTLRAINLPCFGRAILADTVGFVRQLPHTLVAAFKATLEEAAEADLLLHVIDASVDSADQHRRAVQQVLLEIGAADLPLIEVVNKVDCLAGALVDLPPPDGTAPRVYLSAQSGEGIDTLVSALVEALGGQMWQGSLSIAPQHAKLRAQLYDVGAVLGESISSRGDYQLQLRYPKSALDRLLAAAAVSRSQ